MSDFSSLVIAVVLPDVLGTYSDVGNATVLAQRARWRGIPAQVRHITADDTPPTGCDIYLLGGGEDLAQLFATEWLHRHAELIRTLETRAVTLAVCAGLQILGRTMRGRDGHVHEGLGLLDLETVAGTRRAIGEVVSDCTLPGVGRLTGFENHQGVTTLGAGQAPLGRVVSGIGNGTAGPDGHAGEGVRSGRIVGTYLHGPVLARNPALADHILHAATGWTLAPIEVPDQQALRDTYLSAPAARPTRMPRATAVLAGLRPGARR